MFQLRNDAFLESPEFPFDASPFRILDNKPIEPHSHEFIELAYIAEGNGTHSYEGRNYKISAGDVFVIEPGAEHAYWVDSGTSLLVYNILFTPGLLKSEIEMLSSVTPFVNFFYVEPFLRSTVRFQTHLKLDLYEQLEMRTLLDRIVLEIKDKRLGYRIVTKTRLIEMFVFLSRCLDSRNSPSPSFRVDDNMLVHICNFIERHYAQPLSLNQVSQLCGMSASAFSAKFKQHTGRTFIEYRNAVRIRAAAQRIAHSDMKMLAISQEVGFDDLSFFNKLFKVQLGVTPGQYRRQHAQSE